MNYSFKKISGNFGPSEIAVNPQGPGKLSQIAKIDIPNTPGIYEAYYQMYGPNGFFGTQFWIKIEATS